MADRVAALRILGEEGWRLLVDAGIALDDAPAGDALAAAARLATRRPDAPPAERAAALELVTAGQRLAAKLGIEQRLLAVREAVEQSTPARVATWHAQQIPAGCRVLEIGCGCGSDSLALAHRAANLIATDTDPVRAACTHMNLMAFGLGIVIATGEQFTVRDMVNVASEFLDMKLTWQGTGLEEVAVDSEGRRIVAVDSRYFRPTEVESLLGDAGKAKRLLGWEPEIDFRTLVREMVQCDFQEAQKDLKSQAMHES